MTSKPNATSLLACLIAVSSVPAFAGFIDDSTASLALRNMYINRDYRQPEAPINYGEVWAQGFLVRLESGFTEGKVGLGIDALGMLGVRLDSGKGRVNGDSGGGGIGMLPLERDGRPVDEYSELGLSAKIRLSKTILQLGTLQPVLPVLLYNDTRLLPGTYTGGLLTSREIDGLTLHAMRLTEYNLRDQSHRQDFARNSDHFDVLGGSYAIRPDLTVSYYHAHLDNAYKQHFAGVVHNSRFDNGLTLRTDLRYFDTRDSGDRARGKIDNQFFNGMLTLGAGSHKIGVGYQNLSGDNTFQVLNGADPYSVNLSTYWTFWRQDEDAWQLRYDYDFAELGVPGLGFMTRYISGYNIETAAGNDGKEWERNSDLLYRFQNGSLKGLSVHLRNVSYRASGVTGAPDVDENRVILNYTLYLL